MYLRDSKHYVKLIQSCLELGLIARKLCGIFIQEKGLFKPNRSSRLPLSFVDSIISKLFNYLMYIISVLGDLLERLYCSTIPTYHGNSKKRFDLKDATKSSIQTVDTSSLLNTDLGNLNDLRLIWMTVFQCLYYLLLSKINIRFW